MNNKHNNPRGSQPAFTLNGLTGPLTGTSHTITSASLVIGRDPDVDLPIDQEQVSRRHASLTWTGSAWMLKDLGSSNGTFVNGRRIKGTVQLQPGDTIGIGTDVTMQLGTTASGAAGAAAGAAAAAAPKRRRWLWILPVLAILLILLVLGVGTVFFMRGPAERTRPVVWFEDPASGASVIAGEEFNIYAVAQDDDRISRFELWLDGALVEVHNSPLPDGTSPFPLVTRMAFDDAAEHTLVARAFDTSGERAYATVIVTSTMEADGDGDGVPDAEDACPAEGDLAGPDGCPDRDGDGFSDSTDSCPEEAGVEAGAGCPVPTEGDRDGDGLADEADRCPDEPGAPGLDGCPGGPDGGPAGGEDGDRDGDGILDEEDSCPAEPGAPSADGCPDADGDGITDSEDACPEEPGPPAEPGAEDTHGCPVPSDGDADGDGVPDAEDACPAEPGTSDAGGCPDRDGDGVPDAEDACPDDAGLHGADCPADGGGDGGGDGGAPGGADAAADSDGDGVPDRDDLCPDEPGSAENAGCPGFGSGDRDGDGIEDDVDLCPDEAGEAEHGGCPPPGEGEDRDGDGIPDEGEPDESGALPFPDAGDWARIDPVEFEALTFSVDQMYSEIYCYASLAGAPMDRYGPFDPLGENYWDIAEHLGGENSRHIYMDHAELLEVRAECYGDVISVGEDGITSRTDNLGMIYALHPSENWDGHVIEARSAAGDDGLQFEATYRICTPSCDEADLRAPTLRLLHGMGDHRLLIGWDGDRSELSGFRVYRNGTRLFEVPADLYSQSVAGYEPMCGTDGRLEFYITAYQGERESAPSNLAYWSSQECPRVVTVTFQGLSFFDMGGDESWAEGTVGPIYGGFHSTGTSSENLHFNLTDPGNWWGEHDHGYRVRNGYYYDIQGLFDWADTQNASCIGSPCALYQAPASSTVTIDLAPYTDLTFGGYVKDLDGNEDDTLFDGERTLSYDEIRPGLFTVFDRHAELTVLIDVIVGPEVGSSPDLVITDVTQEPTSGQTRVHIFNNASGLVDRDLTVRFERLDGTLIFDQTWEDLSIPTGGSRILMSSEVTLAPSDLRVILDPANAIPEENDDNNTYETPVTMRVEFIRAWAGHCNETSCSIFDCDSEHVFQVWAGYGLERSAVEWVGYNVRFPRDGNLRACGSPCTSDPDEDWYMEGNDRYTFEFEMPADEQLFVMVTGYEKDNATNNDSLGYVLRSYGMDTNWGDNPDTYSGDYGEECICDDPWCSECPVGLTAWWRITRVH